MRYLTAVMSLAVCVLLATPAAHAVFMDDFSSDTNAWFFEGTSFSDEQACLTDDDYSALWQPVLLEAGEYKFSFDFKESLYQIGEATGDEDEDGDIFWVTMSFAAPENKDELQDIYYIYNLALSDTFLDLFTVEYSYDADSNASIQLIEQSSPGSFQEFDDWYRYSMTFVLTETLYAIPTFELYGNYKDSQVCIDNVSIVVIPEPASILLLGLGVIGIAGRSGRRYFRR